MNSALVKSAGLTTLEDELLEDELLDLCGTGNRFALLCLYSSALTLDTSLLIIGQV